MALPMTLCNQRPECNRQQQDREWQHRESIRLGGNKIQDRHYSLFGMIEKALATETELDSSYHQSEVS